ncbi:MAG: hypothetical protein HKO88_09290 [Xanthomonadales bacterium]|nr:hypothetical protein [Xanthomonadales bacterium]
MNKAVHITIFCVMVVFSVKGETQTQPTASPDYDPIHWAYSSFFGTGWYRIKDSRSVFVLRIPPRQTLRESFIDDAGERRIGIEIRYPLSVGLHDLADLGDLIENDNFGTISFVPGVELEIPITPRWYLRPFANFGWGTEFESGESAWIYYAGVKSRYTIPAGKNEWSLLNSLYYAGFTPDNGRSDHLAVADLGIEFRQPLSEFTINSKPVDLHWSLMYSFMGNELHFNLPDGSFDPIDDQLEFGLAVSLHDGPFKLWIFNIHQLGLGYRISSSGRFSAVTFSMRSWFTK